MDKEKLLPQIKDMVYEAGEIILSYYNSDFQQFIKDDSTPITSADIASHKFIKHRLLELTPDIPVLSEESANIPLKIRSKWQHYWLIDPLDGTTEFIKHTDQFAISIALMENNSPVFGLIYIPVWRVLYFTDTNGKAWKECLGEPKQALLAKKYKQPPKKLSLALSKQHSPQEFLPYLNPSFEYDWKYYGSAAVKICLVAEGVVDGYIRIGPTGEWDTASGQIILEGAGGSLVDLNLNRLNYNIKDSLINPDFLTVGDTGLPWNDILIKK